MPRLSQAYPARMENKPERRDAERAGERQDRGIGTYHQIEGCHERGDSFLIVPAIQTGWKRDL